MFNKYDKFYEELYRIKSDIILIKNNYKRNAAFSERQVGWTIDSLAKK